MFPVHFVPVFIAILQICQVWSSESILPGYNDQIIEVDLNTLKGLLDEERLTDEGLGDSMRRSSVDSVQSSGTAALLPANAASQSPIASPSNTQYSSLPMALYLRKPNMVKKSACDKVHRSPLATHSSAVPKNYGLLSASASTTSVLSTGQKSVLTKNRYSTVSRTYANPTAKPVKSNQTLSSSLPSPLPSPTPSPSPSQSPALTRYAKATEILPAESGASSVLAQASYTAVSPNSHLAIGAPTSASGYDASNIQALGQGASIAKLPGLKPLAIEEHQKAAFQDFTGALENHELKPLTNQDVQNLPVVSHSSLTGGSASAPQSQGNNNYGASPNQGYMKQYNGFAETAVPPSYIERPVGSSYNSMNQAQSHGGQHYGGANSGPSYGFSPNGPDAQSFARTLNIGQFYNNAQSGFRQSYGFPSGGFPSGGFENSDSHGLNSRFRAFIL